MLVALLSQCDKPIRQIFQNILQCASIGSNEGIAINDSTMKTVSICAQKGGVGKSTIAVHLAVMAAADGLNVAIADADPQQSATRWWQRRSSDTPKLAQTTPARLKQLKAQADVDLLLVDTAPAHSRDITAAAKESDFVLIPTRPGVLDLDAIGDTVEMVAKIGTPGAIVLNACPPPGLFPVAIVREAKTLLSDAPLPLCPVVLAQRVVLSHALIDGRAVSEFQPKGKAAGEMNELWKWLKREIQ